MTKEPKPGKSKKTDQWTEKQKTVPGGKKVTRESEGRCKEGQARQASHKERMTRSGRDSWKKGKPRPPRT